MYIYIHIYIYIQYKHLYLQNYNLCVYSALFTDTEPDGVKATCISSDSDSITVSVNYTNGCRRETVVEANGMKCKILSTAPTMTICYCTSLQQNTSYNITADSNGHTDSITCNTTMEQRMRKNSASVTTQSAIYCFRTIILYVARNTLSLHSEMPNGSSSEHSDCKCAVCVTSCHNVKPLMAFSVLPTIATFLAILALVPVAGFGIALGLLLYRHRKSNHGT